MSRDLENCLPFLEDIVFNYGRYKPDGKTSPLVLDTLYVLESEELIKKDDGEYTATKAGVDKVMERRDNFLKREFGTMDNYPISIPAELVEAQSCEHANDKFHAVCDETRYLMWDWMEYQEKQGISVSHNVYLDIWSDTFNRVYAKRENIK